MAWKDLSIRERAAYIHTGVRNGLSRIEDIERAYNKFAEGGPIDDDLVQKNDATYVARPPEQVHIRHERDLGGTEGALRRMGHTYSNYSDAKDNPLSPLQETFYNTLRYLKDNVSESIPAGVSNCTLSATQWVDPSNPIKNASSIVGNPAKYNYKKISAEDAIPGNLVIAKVPNEDSYHTMMISGYADKDGEYEFDGKKFKYKKGEPLMTYSRGGHDDSFIRRNIPLSVYTANSDGHTENMFYRYNYPNEFMLPEVIVTAPRKH